MYKEIFYNRWFIWAIVFIVVVDVGLWASIEYTKIATDIQTTEDSVVFTVVVSKKLMSSKVIDGYITIGHEARSFQPCGSNDAAWFMGHSPALQETMSKYREIMAGAKPYTPVFGTLEGEFTDPPVDGFGADYEQAFIIEKFVSIDPNGQCSPQP